MCTYNKYVIMKVKLASKLLAFHLSDFLILYFYQPSHCLYGLHDNQKPKNTGVMIIAPTSHLLTHLYSTIFAYMYVCVYMENCRVTHYVQKWWKSRFTTKSNNCGAISHLPQALCQQSAGSGIIFALNLSVVDSLPHFTVIHFVASTPLYLWTLCYI